MFGFCVSSESNEVLMDEWAYLLSNFKVPLWVRGKTHLKYTQKGGLPNLPVILAVPKNVRASSIAGNENLINFSHPKECIYWFGGKDEIVNVEPDNTIHKVYIPMDEMIIPPTAGAIFLWDRIIKNG